MRVWHLTFVAALGLTLAGCGPASTPNNNSGGSPPADTKAQVGLGDEPAVLRGKMLGTWTGTDKGQPVSYEFAKDNTYKTESDKQKLAGKWKTLDGKTVELTYTLTDEQLALFKERWKITNELNEKGPIIPGPQAEKQPEPKKENTIKMFAAVGGDELSLGPQQLKRAK